MNAVLENLLIDLDKNYPSWDNTSLSSRKEMLQELKFIFTENRELFAQLESKATGRQFENICRYEIQHGLNYIDFLIGCLSSQSSSDHNFSNFMGVEKPHGIGVSCSLLPRHYSILSFFWQSAPALIAGNTVLVKPHENNLKAMDALANQVSHTPLDSILKFTFGGSDTGAALVKSELVKIVTVTGRNETIKSVKKNGWEKRILAEGEGYGITIISEDVCLSEVSSKLINLEETYGSDDCTTAKVWFVHSHHQTKFYEFPFSKNFKTITFTELSENYNDLNLKDKKVLVFYNDIDEVINIRTDKMNILGTSLWCQDFNTIGKFIKNFRSGGISVNTSHTLPLCCEHNGWSGTHAFSFQGKNALNNFQVHKSIVIKTGH